MRVIVTGGRNRRDRATIFAAIEDAYCEAADRGQPFELAVGDCPTGADAIAREWWERGGPRGPGDRLIVFRAHWEVNGRAAGPIRNTEMVGEGGDVCLGFPDVESSGTWDCVRKAVRAGIEARIRPEGKA